MAGSQMETLYEDLRAHKGATAEQAERYIAALDGSDDDVDFELRCLRGLVEKVRVKRHAYEVEAAAEQARREARDAARALS